MFLQSLLNLRNSAIWHGEIKGSYRAKLQKFSNLRLNNAHCVGKGKYNTKIQVFFSFQTFRVGPYGALEHKITFPKAIIDTWKRKFFLSTVCNLIHFYQKLMIWSSAMFTNPTFHFFRSAHWSHLGWKNAKKVNKKSRRNSFEKCLEVFGAKRRAMITYIQLSFFISCTFSNQFGAVCKSNSIAVVVIVVAQNHLFSRDEWRHIQLTGDW